MIVPMATTLSRLSSLLLTSSLFPAEDPARAILQLRADHFSNLVTWSTVLVAIGVALEGVEIVHDVIAWIKQKRRKRHELLVSNEVAKIFPSGETRGHTESHSDHPRWVKRVLRLGLIAVVIGVVGEWRYGAKLEDSHNAIHEYDIALLGDAAKSAKTAHDEANAVDKEAKDLKTRLDAASIELADVEQTALALSPRWLLLQNGEDVFVKALKSFPGQRVTVVTCGNEDTERFAFEEMLISSSFPKAGWDKSGWTRWTNCPNMLTGGNQIFFVSASRSADAQWVEPACGRFSTGDAGDVLCDALYGLKIFTHAWREKPLPQEEGIQKARMFFGDGIPGSPAELAYKDPGRIFLLIGPNAPMLSAKHPHKKQANKQNAKP